MYKTHPCIKKIEKPVLTYRDSVEGSALTFNAGVAKWQGKYVMLFRNDYGDWETQTVARKVDVRVAFSDDGIHWKAEPNPILQELLEDDDNFWVYDPRLTVIDDVAYVCFALDTKYGIRGGIAKTTDFKKFEVLSLAAPDNRNMALFPEKVNGKYIRLERPMPVYGRAWLEPGFDVWMSQSPDLRYWGDTTLILSTDQVPFADDKIGPAAPPVKTDEGWLTLFHAVRFDPTLGKNGWEEKWQKIYYAGIMLLDLKDPTKVIGIYDEPLIVPENHWETEVGYRQNVIFPGGMILEPDGEVKIYYGASDSFECLATAEVKDLIALCKA